MYAASGPTQSRTLSAARPLAVASLLYLALSAAVFWPLLAALSRSLLGPAEDNLQDLWNSWYFAEHVRSLNDALYTNLIKFPEGANLFYHSFAYPKTILVALIDMIFPLDFGDLVALQNLLILTSFPIGALGAYCFIKHFTHESVGASMGGAVFAFNPSHIEQALHHLHVSSIDFLPFFALFFVRWIDSGGARFLILSSIFYTLSAMSGFYYAFYCLYFMIFYVAFDAYRRWALPKPSRALATIVPVATFCLVASPILLPMVRAALAGADVYYPGSDFFVADLAGYVVFPYLHPFASLTTGINWRLSGNEWEKTVYLGLVNLCLLGWLLIRAQIVNRQLRIFIIGGMLLFAALASGSWLHVLGKQIAPMPDLLLDQLPFFRNVRTPSRAVVFVYLFLSLATALAIADIRTTRARGANVLVATLAVLLALDWYPTKLPETRLACSPGYRIIARDPEPGFGVLDLPSSYSGQNAAMAYQACHGRPIVMGIVARELTTSLRDRIDLSDLQTQRPQLRDNKIKYIIIHRQFRAELDPVHTERNQVFVWPAAGPTIADYERAYDVVFADPSITIFKVW